MFPPTWCASLSSSTFHDRRAIRSRHSTRGCKAAMIHCRSTTRALLVFDHQMRMMNLLTRIGWDARVALAQHRRDVAGLMAQAASDVADYMLFVDEAPLAGPVSGSSGFAETFSAQGPSDRHGRSLRQLDLSTRLMRYP